MMLYHNGAPRIDSLIKQICADYAKGMTSFEQYLAALAAYRYVNSVERTPS